MSLGLAVSLWDQGISPYDFGIRTDYFLQPNQPMAYVYTERPVYRPNQPVYFKGIIRHNDDLTYRPAPIRRSASRHHLL